MGLFDKFKKKKETVLSFNEVIADTLYDLKNNSNACTLSSGETEDGKIVIPESVLGEKLKIFIRYLGERDLLDKDYMENSRNIDKLACSEFWEEKDSYRRLQNAFYEYMIEHNFKLERGLPKEETNRNHIDIKQYKELTNFENTKKIVESINLDIPNETDIKDLKKFVVNKNEKILNDIIKPKEEMIKSLYTENKALHKELSKQTKIVDEAEKYQKERQMIMSNNRALHNRVDENQGKYDENHPDDVYVCFSVSIKFFED